MKSLRMCENGLDESGNQLAGGFYFVIWASKSDYDHTCNNLGLPGHWSSKKPCKDCLVTETKLRDVSRDATWKLTLFEELGEKTWRDHCTAMHKVPVSLFAPRNKGGLGMWVAFTFYDNLHCMDLGVAAHINGNVLWHFTFTDMLGAALNPQQR